MFKFGLLSLIAMKIVVSLLFECTSVNEIVLYKLSPDKTVIVTVKGKGSTGDAGDVKGTLEDLKNKFPSIIFGTVYVNEFDVVGTTREIDRIIKKYGNDEVYLNVTEGRKTMFLSGVYAASLNKGLVEDVFYLRKDNNELMPVPISLPNFEISGNKIKILEQFDRGNKDINDIKDKLGVHRSLVYAALKDLVKKGYINKGFRLTDYGKICLFANKRGASK